MKEIINFGSISAIFALGSKFFGEYIQIQDSKTLLLAVILMFAMGLVLDMLIGASVLLMPVGVGCLTIIPLIVVAFVFTPLRLWILDTYLAGFSINGLWTYISLTAMISIFRVRSTN